MPYTLSPDPCNLKPRLARYYNATLSIWLSVDPMSDKYPGVSPYAYCANNPVAYLMTLGKSMKKGTHYGWKVQQLCKSGMGLIDVATD